MRGKVAYRSVALIVASVLVSVGISVPVTVWWVTQVAPGDTGEVLAGAPASPASTSPTPQSSPSPGVWDPAVFAAPSNLDQLIVDVEASLLDVWCGDVYSGTGWVIDTDATPVIRDGAVDGPLFDALVITAWHVVEDCTTSAEGLAVYRGQDKVPAQLLNWHKKLDVAVISAQVRAPGLGVDVAVPVGSWTMGSGFPLSDEPTAVFGPVLDVDGFDIYTQMPARPGHSGGPLVNSAGQVVGVMKSLPLDEESGEPYGWAISTSVRALCRKVLSCPAGVISAPR